MQDILEFLRAILKADLIQVFDGAIFRRVFIVAADFVVDEDAQVVLVSESIGSTKTYDLAAVSPGDEMVREALAYEVIDQVAYGTRGVELPDEVLLPPFMSHEAGKGKEVAYARLDRREDPPKPIFNPIAKGRGVLHARIGQLFYPFFFS